MKDPALLKPGFVDRCPECQRGVFVGGLCTHCGRSKSTGELVHVLCGRGFDDIEQFNAHVCGNACPGMIEVPKSAGRPRKHVDTAAKQRAYRARRRRRSVTKW